MPLTTETILDADDALTPSITAHQSAHSHFRDGLIDLAAGTAGGIANVYTGQPLDTVKVKMQTFPHLYQSSVKCFTETFRADGIRGLYAGTLPALVANVAENAILFTAYGYCQKGVVRARGKESVSQLSPVENATAGGMAAFFAALALCPTELVKCRLQAVREMRHISGEVTTEANRVTPWSLCRQIFREEGVRGFGRGMMPTMAREIPGYFFFFGGYETCRYLLTPVGKTKDDIGLLRTAVSGSVGGMALWTSIFPADVIKSRMQIQGKGSLVATFLQILREEGVRALYKGLTPTLVRTCLSSGCLFISYEYTKKFLHAFSNP
uniref:Mitochondrial ornithine transporter 1 n=2 Tax=Plectus sambesii TaxID=2011161 RepID=A0A914XS63_9BILA